MTDIAGCRLPLVFEPGEDWEYGVGIDWAGQMVERANGGKSLEAYLQDNVWGPLGIQSMTFHLETKDDVRDRMVDMTAKDPSTGALVHTDERVVPNPAKDALGGAGLYGNAVDYMKILASVLRDDGKLLKSTIHAELFQPQLSEKTIKSLMQKVPDISPNSALPLSWGLGGRLNLADYKDNRRKKGSLAWGGLPNLYWVRGFHFVLR